MNRFKEIHNIEGTLLRTIVSYGNWKHFLNSLVLAKYLLHYYTKHLTFSVNLSQSAFFKLEKQK